MTPNNVVIRGLNCKVAKMTRFQTKYNFPPEKLTEEIAKRSRHLPHSYRNQYIYITRHDFGRTLASLSDNTRNKTYDLLFAHEDTLDDIYAIIREIEADIDRELESQRILSLLEDDNN